MDSYKTISRERVGEGYYTEKRSKFLAFSHHVDTVDDVKELVAQYRKKYFDARHVCWAYMLGHERTDFRANDDGEPSSTAGKPILGQINSFELTNIVIVVIRYFGGIKLGTSGLIVAYREAAAEAIRAGEIIECHEQATVTFTFPYLGMNDVMKVLKSEDLKILSQDFDNCCTITVQLNADKVAPLKTRLADIGGISFVE